MRAASLLHHTSEWLHGNFCKQAIALKMPAEVS